MSVPKQALMRSDLCFKNLNGTVAFSSSRHFMKMNTEKRTPHSIKSPMIVEDFQGWVVPPHCNASKRQHIAEIKTIAPSMSVWSSLTLIERERSRWSSPFNFRKNNTTKNTGTPTGTLLLAHQSDCSWQTKARSIQTSKNTISS